MSDTGAIDVAGVMVRLEPIRAANVWDVLKLRVAEGQREFVAPNEASIIEAYVAIVAGGHAFPFAVVADGVPVGFCMVGYDVDDDWEDAPEVAHGAYSLWRLMIDERYQGRGFGRAAVGLALEFVRSWPCGTSELCWVSYEPENEVARRLYQSFGFQETGERDGEELIAVLRL